MEWLQVALQGLWQGITQVLFIGLIMLPIFIVLQVFKETGWLDVVSRWLAPAMTPLALPGTAATPLAAGLIFGLTLGSGVVVQGAEEGELNRRQLTIVMTFIGLFHSVFEEPAYFLPLGVILWPAMLVRLGVAVLFGLIMAWVLPTPPGSPGPAAGYTAGPRTRRHSPGRPKPPGPA